MKILVLILLCTLILEGYSSDENNHPIIGVLAQEMSYSLELLYPGQYKSFIAASYVKFVEGAGARVIPVWIGQNKQYYKDVMNKTNGLLFPGGATWFNQSNGYADAGMILYDLAIEENNRGHVYPILGICLGMELMIYAANGGAEYRETCSALDVALPLEFKSDFKNSKMFGPASSDIITDLETKNITANIHTYCVTEKILEDLDIADKWHVLSLSKDVKGSEFISSIESRNYPFFGLQFHPEKNIYEWKPKKSLIHTRESIQAGQYFAGIFVNTARLNNNKFNSRAEEQNALIWNYPVTYTGIKGNSYEQCYLFKDNITQQVDYRENEIY